MVHRDQRRKLQREWLKARRESWITANGPCSSCGSNNSLQVDHIDRKTKISHRVWSWRRERREQELAKCQVLCDKCHKLKSKLEAQNYLRKVSHGTPHEYLRHRCRCSDCKNAYSTWRKNKYVRTGN